MTKLINRNTTIPTKKSQVFSTAADGQTAIEVKIYQGERELVRDNKLLGNFNLVGIPPAPKGVPQIEITFDIDADGIVNVSAKDKATNKDQSMTIASSSGLSDKDIERMVSESEQYAESDKARRALIEEANKADSVCTDTEKAMNEFKDQLDATEKEKVTKLVTELRELAAKGQTGDASITADGIREKINETQQASLGLFQKVYEKRAAENQSSEQPAENNSEPKKD
jgi:molecular chaperone DnaK